MGPAAVDPLIVGLSDDQEFAFVFDTRIEAADAAFDVDVYVIPDERDLERALEAVDVDRVDEATANAGDDVDVRDLDEDDLAEVEEVLD
jgi:chemotaxis protein CheC